MFKQKIFLTLIFVFLLFPLDTAKAAEPINRGFSISPGIIEDWLNPGEKKEEFVYIINNTGQTNTFIFEAEDFEAGSNPDESVKLLGTEKSSTSLKNHIVPEVPEITLNNGETKKVKVTIDVPRDTPPGGLYGSFLAKTKVSESKDINLGAQVVSRLGVLFFVGINGKIYNSGHITEFSTKQYCEEDKNSKCVNKRLFRIVFQNSGSAHLVIDGKIEIKNIFGRKIDETSIKKWFVMPRSSKAKEIVWTERESMFGLYFAHLTLDTGYNGLAEERTVPFFVFNFNKILLVIPLLILAFLIYRVLKKNFKMIIMRRRDKIKSK